MSIARLFRPIAGPSRVKASEELGSARTSHSQNLDISSTPASILDPDTGSTPYSESRDLISPHEIYMYLY